MKSQATTLLKILATWSILATFTAFILAFLLYKKNVTTLEGTHSTSQQWAIYEQFRFIEQWLVSSMSFDRDHYMANQKIALNWIPKELREFHQSESLRAFQSLQKGPFQQAAIVLNIKKLTPQNDFQAFIQLRQKTGSVLNNIWSKSTLQILAVQPTDENPAGIWLVPKATETLFENTYRRPTAQSMMIKFPCRAHPDGPQRPGVRIRPLNVLQTEYLVENPSTKTETLDFRCLDRSFAIATGGSSDLHELYIQVGESEGKSSQQQLDPDVKKIIKNKMGFVPN